MKTGLLFASLAGAVAIATPASAIAPGIDLSSGRFSIDIVGYVPVICRATVDASMVGTSSGAVNLGSLKEFCNDPSGYRVVADYSPSLAGATMLVDGNSVPLDASGSAVVSTSDQAAINTRQVSLELPEGVSNGTVSFRIETR